MTESWNRFWFREAAPLGVIAARVLLASNALWILLSRPMLPALRAWPSVFWDPVDPAILRRFLIFEIPVAVEIALFWILCLSLAATIAGLAPRLNCFVSALLLYHFAPFEDVLASVGGPFFHGLTIPVTGLMILAVADRPRLESDPSPEWRWPLALIRLLFAFTYLFSGISKLANPGLVWATAANFEGLVLGMVFPDVRPAWGSVFIGNDLLNWGGAIAGIAMDLLFITAVFSRRAARWIVPAAAAVHLLVVPVLGVVFLNLPLLLLFVNWDWVQQKQPMSALLREPVSGRPAE
ncbi:MAG: hypothetical protein ACRD2J_17410 [Thermoanaerobaculia bacterium]